MKKARKAKKYFVRKSTIIISLLLLVLSLGVFIWLQVNPENHSSLVASVIKEVLLVLISILGSNLILNVIIEKNEKNNMLDDFMTNDILVSEYFYKGLTQENKKRLSDALVLKEEFDGNDDLVEMANSVHKKLIESQQSYYFEECEIKVDIFDRGSYFEKEVIRKARVIPYKDTVKVTDFRLVAINCIKINNIDALQWTSLTVKGKNIDLKNDIRVASTPIADSIYSHNGYDTHLEFFLKNALVLNKKRPTELVLKYTVMCPKSDIVSTYRSSAPCKRFSVECRIFPKDRYKLLTSAFGFWDHANGNMNNGAENETRVRFDDWIFKDDGVSIAIKENRTNYD